LTISVSSLFTWFQTAAVTVEADVVKVVAAVKADVAVAETYILAAVHWLATNAPAIASDLQLALSLAGAVGGVPLPVLAAANASVSALNAFAAAQNAVAAQTGTAALITAAQSVAVGYKAFTSAQAAVANAKAAAASAAVPTVAPASA
jgi:hypothetical protein